MAKYSYIIKGGTIIDGSGFPMTSGDVGISGETIKDIGVLDETDAEFVIDATGLFAAPGFIDITNHSDTHWTLFSAPMQESMLMQGITTIVGGACGSSLAPIAHAGALGGLQKWVDISKINVNWTSTEEFLEELRSHKLGVNFATMAGHGTLRRNIAGAEGRALSREELLSLELLLKRALDDGAMGLSFGLATSHGRSATQDEILALARTAKDAGKPVFFHLRDEGRRFMASVVETINVARLTGARVHIAHFKAIGRKAWSDTERVLKMLRKARKDEKLPIWVNFFPYLRTGSLLYTLLPEWIKQGGAKGILATLTDKSKRDDVLLSIRELTLHYNNITIAQTTHESGVVGKTIAEHASDLEITPEEAVVQLLIVNGLGVTILGRTLASRNLVSIIREGFSMFATDGVGYGHNHRGLAHPRSYGSTARFLSRAVREHGILSWEEAVKKMTSMPAEHMGMKGHRGILKAGAFADIVIFDPDTIKDNSKYADPYHYSRGIEYVFVNGNLAVKKGELAGASGGQVLRGV